MNIFLPGFFSFFPLFLISILGHFYFLFLGLFFPFFWPFLSFSRAVKDVKLGHLECRKCLIHVEIVVKQATNFVILHLHSLNVPVLLRNPMLYYKDAKSIKRINWAQLHVPVLLRGHIFRVMHARNTKRAKNCVPFVIMRMQVRFFLNTTITD